MTDLALETAEARILARRRELGISLVPAVPASVLPVGPASGPTACMKCGEPVTLDAPVQPKSIVCNPCADAALAAERADSTELRARNFAPFTGTPAGYASMSLETWRADRTPLPAGVRRWLAAPDRNLVLWGPQGIGKTHLAVACLRFLWDDAKTSLWFCEAPSLNDDLVRDIRDGAASRTTDRLLQRRWLLVDDAARLRQSNFSREAFAAIVYQRHAAGKFHIVTTNVDPASSYAAATDGKGNEDNVSGPLWSRLLEGAEVVGPADGLPMDDYRLSGGR